MSDSAYTCKCVLYCLAHAQVGVSIANDAIKVFHDHKVSVEALEDLSMLANQKLGGDPKRWSLGSLTEMLICKKVSFGLVMVSQYFLFLMFNLVSENNDVPLKKWVIILQ